MKKQFGKKLREIRLRKNYTQEKLSELIGIKPENYSRIENGLSFPKPENIEKISSILNVEIFELFQFEYLKSNEEIKKIIFSVLEKDDETALIVYKFLKSIGKI